MSVLSFCHVSADLVLKNFSARECSKSALVLIFSAGTIFTGLICICFIKVGKSTDTVYKKKKKKEKEKKPARYVISIQISGERTAAAYVITVFT